MSYSTIYSQNSVQHDWTLNFPPVLDYEAFGIIDMEKDKQGNLYLLGGRSVTGISEWITVKIIISSFVVEWFATFEVNGYRNVGAIDLDIDSTGNCYVAGIGVSDISGYYDYLVAKYNPSGKQEWAAAYDGTLSRADYVNDMFVDNLGNAYLTGFSREESEFYSNATTVKFNSDGVMEWKATHDNSTNFDEEGRGLVVDNSGNVYVACKTYTTSVEFLTIKYNSAGVEQWTKLAGSTTQNEWAQFIGLDNSGEVNVGGTAYLTNPPPYDPIGYYMIKYSPDGSYAVGGNTYNSSSTMRGMVVSPQGNVYVTGEASGTNQSRDFVTVKYNSSGTLQWVKRFNYAGIDRPTDIVIDENENIFITGYSTIPSVQAYAITVKYNSSGDSLWSNIYTHQNFQNNSASKIVLDEPGDMYVAIYYYNTGNTVVNELIKLNNNGVYQWAYNYKCLSQPTSIKEDSDGNIYITGFGGLNQSMWDYITMKCDSSGKIKWIRTYNGPANEADQANDIELDREGNVYVTGGSKGIGTDFDFATIKYDSAGNEQWVGRYNAPAFYSDIAGHVSVDAEGNVYVSGTSLGSTSGSDIATVKYNNLGQFQWVKRYNSTANGNDLSQGLEVDFSGNIFVAGTSDSTGSLYDYVTIKYDPSGNVEWTKRYNGPANDGDLVSSMVLDNSGNVYVTGWSFGNGTQSDYATVKYNNSGEEQWTARWDDPASSYDYANDIAVDGDGNVYVTGISQGMGTDNDYTTVKYNSLGEQQWAVPYNGQSNGSDVAYHVTLDHLGDIYVTGYSNNNAEYSTIKYNKQGVQQWNMNYSIADYQSTPTDLLVDNSGNVLVAGYSNKVGQEWIWSIVKYRQPGFVPSDVGTETTPPTEFVLYQNYPNPFNPTTKISWQSPVSTRQSLKVYDILGNEVATLVDEERPAGSYEVIFDANYLSRGISTRGGYASGVYFYSLRAGEFVQTKKLILIR
jgi:uncharacterized delta-60 repeat protein